MPILTPEKLKKLQEKVKATKKPVEYKYPTKKSLEERQKDAILRHASGRKLARMKKEANIKKKQARLAAEAFKNRYIPNEINWEKLQQYLD